MNTVESKLIYLLYILSHRNYAPVNTESELGWTDSRALKFIDLLRQHEVLWKVDREDYSDRFQRCIMFLPDVW